MDAIFPLFIGACVSGKGQLEPASDIVDRLLNEFVASGGRWYEAEVRRLRGDILRLRVNRFRKRRRGMRPPPPLRAGKVQRCGN